MIDLELGQIWDFHSDDKNLKLEIIKIESLNNTKVIHIAILDNNNEYIIEHLPFSENAILNSIISLHKESGDSIKHENEGYNYWKQEFLLGKAGVYEINVNQALDL